MSKAKSSAKRKRAETELSSSSSHANELSERPATAVHESDQQAVPTDQVNLRFVQHPYPYLYTCSLACCSPAHVTDSCLARGLTTCMCRTTDCKLPGFQHQRRYVNLQAQLTLSGSSTSMFTFVHPWPHRLPKLYKRHLGVIRTVTSRLGPQEDQG